MSSSSFKPLLAAAAVLALGIGGALGLVLRHRSAAAGGPASAPAQAMPPAPAPPPAEPPPPPVESAPSPGAPAPEEPGPVARPAPTVVQGADDGQRARIVVDASGLMAPSPPPAGPPPDPEAGDDEVRIGPLRVRTGQFDAWTVTRQEEGVLCRNPSEPTRLRMFHATFRDAKAARIAAGVSVVEAAEVQPVPAVGVLFGWRDEPGGRASYWMVVARQDGSVAVLRQTGQGLERKLESKPVGAVPQVRQLEVLSLPEGGFEVRAEGRRVGALQNKAVELGQRVGVVVMGQGAFRVHAFEAQQLAR